MKKIKKWEVEIGNIPSEEMIWIHLNVGNGSRNIVDCMHTIIDEVTNTLWHINFNDFFRFFLFDKSLFDSIQLTEPIHFELRFWELRLRETASFVWFSFQKQWIWRTQIGYEFNYGKFGNFQSKSCKLRHLRSKDYFSIEKQVNSCSCNQKEMDFVFLIRIPSWFWACF